MLKTFGALARRIKDQCRSERGNLTAVTSIAAIPIIAAAGIAIDLGRMSRVHDQLQTITDGAALAAASARNLSGSSDEIRTARSKIAESFLTAGLADLKDIESMEKPVVEASSSDISVSVGATVKGTLSNVLNLLPGDSPDHNRYRIAASSQANWTTKPGPLCILALNETSEKSLEVQGTADVLAEGCSVRVNSSSSSGLLLNGTATLKAKSICVRGGYVGSGFQPEPRTGSKCYKADPYAAAFKDTYAKTYTGSVPVRHNGYNTSSKKFMPAVYSGSNSTTIQPGRYLGGIEVKAGATVKMAAGVYFIENGKFEVQNGTVMNEGSGGVTIILTHPDAASKEIQNSDTRVLIQAQANVMLHATKTGDFAGILFAQHPNLLTGTSKSTANTVIGGGTKELTGSLYYPKNIFYMTGGGTGTMTFPEKIAVDDPVFAIIADKILIEGNGQISVGGAAEAGSAGLPSLPSVDDVDTIVSLR